MKNRPLKKACIFEKIHLHYFLIICINSFYSIISNAQKDYHLELLSRVKIAEHASSIWGYTDPQGTEYGILGTSQGVRIYSLADPALPTELLFIPCSSSAWRELKTAGEFAYITTEAEDGLLIVDLRKIQDSIPYKFVKSFVTAQGDSLSIISAHTIYVDEKNYIYLSGARPIGAGFIILDPGTDPFHPVILNHNEDEYIHETHAANDTMYAAELFSGVFSIWDIQDRTNPKRISDHQTAFHFTHSVWKEKNRPFLYTADEVASAVVEAWDISDPFTIIKTDEFKVNNPNAPYVIPHNVFHLNDKLYVSYYTEGVRILDTKDPQNLVEVAYYDTHDEHIDGFHGCWSVFPFFKSGICIASDIENGMFVLKYDRNEPSYIHALIADKSNSNPIYNASLRIVQGNRNVEAFSNIQGLLRTGFPEEDSVNILVTKKGYYPDSFKLRLYKDSVIDLRILLQELPQHHLNIIVKDKKTGLFIPDAKIKLYNTDFSFLSTTDLNGNSQLDNIYENKWTLVAGKWFYKQFALKNFELNADRIIEIELEEGYEDDFILDLGWTTQSTDPLVSWSIGDFSEIPVPSSNFPSRDIEGDLGNSCYYTTNYNSSGLDYNIHGEVKLVSPLMNLSSFSSIDLSFYDWAYGGFISSKEMVLQFPDTAIIIEKIPELLTGQFNPVSTIHLDLKNRRRDSVHFVFRLFNDSATAEMAIRLMGALDVFRLTGNTIVRNYELNRNSQISLFPNPVDHILFIHSSIPSNSGVIKIYNSIGQLMRNEPVSDTGDNTIDVSQLNCGNYFLKIGENPCMMFSKVKW
jgi:choice-of-anchor B domain-containing protein